MKLGICLKYALQFEIPTKIEMVQRNAVKWIKHEMVKCQSCREILDDLQWSTPENRRKNTWLTCFYKLRNRLIDITEGYLSTSMTTRYSGKLSHSQNYNQLTAIANLLKFSICHREISLSNAFLHSFIAMTTIDCLKSHLY